MYLKKIIAQGFKSFADNTIIDTMTIEVAPKSRIEIRCEGNGVLYVGGATATLEVTYFGADGSTPTYETNDATIATVNE